MFEAQKIIFTGPVGVGKTTAITAISDEAPIKTEALASDETALLKDNTTVAMDYGTLRLDDGSLVHLYGTPGQDRFDFMWDILAENGIGLILLLDNTREDPLDDLSHYLEAFKGFISEREMVVGVNRYNEKNRPGLYSYHTRLKQHGINAPVFEIDSRNRSDIKVLMLSLLAMLDTSLQR